MPLSKRLSGGRYAAGMLSSTASSFRRIWLIAGDWAVALLRGSLPYQTVDAETGFCCGSCCSCRKAVDLAVNSARKTGHQHNVWVRYGSYRVVPPALDAKSRRPYLHPELRARLGHRNVSRL